VYTIPVLHALTTGPDRDELRRILSAGPPDGELLDRALGIVRSSGSVDHAPAGGFRGGTRAGEVAGRLAGGGGPHTMGTRARFLAVRCGAEVEAKGPSDALLGYGRAGEGAET